MFWVFCWKWKLTKDESLVSEEKITLYFQKSELIRSHTLQEIYTSHLLLIFILLNPDFKTNKKILCELNLKFENFIMLSTQPKAQIMVLLYLL